MSRKLAAALVVTVALASIPEAAARPLVLKSGKTLEVDDYRIEGDEVVIVTKRGKERRIARSLVVEEPTAAPQSAAPDGKLPPAAGEAPSHDAWRSRYVKLQARVDAAQARLDALAAKSDAANGDVDVASDGTKIEGMRAGRGYYAEKRRAEAELARAQAAMDRLREEAAAAGVPPGVVR